MRTMTLWHNRRSAYLLLLGVLIPAATALGQEPVVDTASVTLMLTSQLDIPKSAQDHLTNVRAVAVTHGGAALILDAQRGRLGMYSREGSLVHDVPVGLVGNAAVPVLIAPFGAGGFLVYDAVGHRVNMYTDGDRSVVKSGSISVMPETAKDMCTLGDTVYLLADHDDRTIHMYGMHGRIQRSFGLAPGSNRPVRSAVVGAGGHMACSEKSGTIVAAFVAAGRVSAFRTDGARLWDYAVPDFHGIEIRTLPDSSAQLRWSGNDRDGVVSVFSLDGGYAAVQVRRMRPTGNRLETIILRLRDGVAVGSQINIPLVTRSAGVFLIGTDDVQPLHARLYTYRLDAKGR